jgi:hypothetical protein
MCRGTAWPTPIVGVPNLFRAFAHNIGASPFAFSPGRAKNLEVAASGYQSADKR